MRFSASAAAIFFLTVTTATAQQQPQSEPEAAGTPLLKEPRQMAAAFQFAGKYLKDDGGQRKAGWYPVFKTNVTGDGWISAGSGYRIALGNGDAWFDGSAAVSWRGYKTAQGTFEYVNLLQRRLSVGTQVMWQDLTQVQYFGAGPQQPRDQRSDYRLKTTDVLGFATYRPLEPLAFEARLGRVTRPTISSSAGPFDRGYPDATVTFRQEAGFEPERQPAFLHGHLSATLDTRNAPGHPTSGGLYRTAASWFSDRDTGAYSFRRYEVEGLRFVPLSPSRWTLAFHGWAVVSDTSGGRQIPSYLLPSLGGSTTLRSYSDYRFHDRNLLLVSAESRWALFEHVDVALFVDAGSVAPRIRDFTLKERSYGVGLRAHLNSSTLARFDVAHGPEGWRLLMRLNEPFRLNRLTRRTAAVPFVP